MTSDKEILITGASGMLGSKVSSVLAEKGFQILAVFDSNEKFVPDGKNVKKTHLDITGEINPNRFKNTHTIIHCAAITDVNFCELNKPFCREVNVAGTKNLINLAKSLNAQFIYISTPMVFSGRKGNYSENDETGPLNYYGKTKSQAEKAVLKYGKGLVVRVNPIGKRPLGAHPSFMQWFMDTASSNRSFSLFTDVVINPVSTATLADFLSKIIDKFKPGILHLGSRDRVNKAEIWEEVLELFPDYSGTVTRLSVDKTRDGKAASRPHEMWLNVDKAVGLGYSLPSWKEEVRIVLNEILNRK
ncbi:MAG: SDR family oxidoreductase [Candidatus Yanofskybacteria bacterium]|nr:SDR family oxidoreductase [Candidatus Yanofskybacteria bacterium]